MLAFEERRQDAEKVLDDRIESLEKEVRRLREKRRRLKGQGAPNPASTG